MDVYRVHAGAMTAVEAAMDALKQELQLLEIPDEKHLMTVFFLGVMTAKYATLRPDQKLPASVMSELMTKEAELWKEWDN